MCSRCQKLVKQDGDRWSDQQTGAGAASGRSYSWVRLGSVWSGGIVHQGLAGPRRANGNRKLLKCFLVGGAAPALRRLGGAEHDATPDCLSGCDANTAGETGLPLLVFVQPPLFMRVRAMLPRVEGARELAFATDLDVAASR